MSKPANTYSVGAYCNNCKQTILVYLAKGTVQKAALDKSCPSCGLAGYITIPT